LITPKQIDEWIQEVEARPSSASAILRSIAARLAELDSWNEELLTDNIALRSGSRAEEYEKRIAALEYQLALLKRQVGPGALDALPAAESASLLVFNVRGQVLRLALHPDALQPGVELGRLPTADTGVPPGLLAIGPREELLFAFDSGRTSTLPADQIPLIEGALGWRQSYRVEVRPGEELAAVLPISRMALHDTCIQVSRRGCAKLMLKTTFQNFVSRNSIGSGVKRKPDKMAALVFCAREGRLALASHEGALLSIDASLLPYTSDEIIQLGSSDHIVAAFSPGSKSALLVVTNTGKAIQREMDWLEPASSFKSRGQAAFSSSRRDAGVRVVGAAAVDESDWGALLRSDGSLSACRVADLFAAGSVELGESELLSFTTFSMAG
jgi:hypothetical protein